MKKDILKQIKIAKTKKSWPELEKLTRFNWPENKKDFLYKLEQIIPLLKQVGLNELAIEYEKRLNIAKTIKIYRGSIKMIMFIICSKDLLLEII